MGFLKKYTEVKHIVLFWLKIQYTNRHMMENVCPDLESTYQNKFKKFCFLSCHQNFVDSSYYRDSPVNLKLNELKVFPTSIKGKILRNCQK
jgi:hypothetical protein